MNYGTLDGRALIEPAAGQAELVRLCVGDVFLCRDEAQAGAIAEALQIAAERAAADFGAAARLGGWTEKRRCRGSACLLPTIVVGTGVPAG